MDLLSVKPEWGRKPASVETEKVVTLASEETTMENIHDRCSVRAVTDRIIPSNSTYYGVWCTKYSEEFCSSTYAKLNFFNNFE